RRRKRAPEHAILGVERHHGVGIVLGEHSSPLLSRCRDVFLRIRRGGLRREACTQHQHDTDAWTWSHDFLPGLYSCLKDQARPSVPVRALVPATVGAWCGGAALTAFQFES